MIKTIAALCALSFVVAFGGTVQAQPTLVANPYGVDPEHYQCYSITQTTFAPRSVTLRDQFGFRQVRVLRPVLLCPPVSKNNGLLADKVSHLVCYEIVNGLVPNRRVEIANQFGKLQFTVQRASLLCVPSLKRLLPQ